MRVIGSGSRLLIVMALGFLGLIACQGRAQEAAMGADVAGSAPPTEATATVSRQSRATAVSTATEAPTLIPTAADEAQLTTETRTAATLPEDVEGARLPAGFSLTKFSDIFRPSGMVFDAAGRLFVTSADGTVSILEDENGDDKADSRTVIATGLRAPLGLALQPETGDLYITSVGQIDILRGGDGASDFGELELFAGDLPYSQHWTNTPKFGPDGMLYVGIGSTCDACEEEDPRSASIMRFDPATRAGEVIASGLRNPYDLDFHPVTGELFATDNGRDDLGPDRPREELNLIREGRDYGWPDCWDDNSQRGCEDAERAVAFFAAHASANSFTFYNDTLFPVGYRTEGETAVAYAVLFGNFTPDGAETGVVRIILRPDGNSYRSEVDWLARWGGNPLAIAVAPDGSLYVGDHTGGAIYRISYGETIE